MATQKMHTENGAIEAGFSQSLKWESLHCESDDFKVEWDDYLNGYIITFADGKRAQTQLDIEQNRLHADFGESYLERYTEHDDELSEEQHELVEDFVNKVNKMQRNSIWS